MTAAAAADNSTKESRLRDVTTLLLRDYDDDKDAMPDTSSVAHIDRSSKNSLLDDKTSAAIQNNPGLISAVLGTELSIVSLNNGGISQIFKGKKHEANLYFVRALLKTYGRDVNTKNFRALPAPPTPPTTASPCRQSFRWKNLLKPKKLLKRHRNRARRQQRQRQQSSEPSASTETCSTESTSPSATSADSDQATDSTSTDSSSNTDSTPGDSIDDEDRCSAVNPLTEEYEDKGLQVYNKMASIDPEITNEHLIHAIVVYNVGQIHVLKDEPEEAYVWFSNAIRELTQMEENDSVENQQQHPLVNLATCYHNLGYVYYCMDKHHHSKWSYQLSYKYAKKLSKELNDKTMLAKTLNCLAVLQFHTSSSNQDSTLQLLKQSHNVLKAHEEEQQSVATVLNNTARIHFYRKEYAEALELYRQALEIRQQVLGEDHLDAAATVYSIGMTLHNQGKRDEALKMYQQFLEIAQPHRLVHGDVAMAHKNMAQIHQDQGRHTEALEMFEASLEEAKKALGENHAEIELILIKIGGVHHLMSDLTKAMEYYNRALELDLLEHDDNDILRTLSNIGSIHQHQNEHKKALEVYQKLLSAQIGRFGDGELVVSNTLSQIAWSNFVLEENEESLEYYQRALAIRRDHLGNEHFDVTASLRQIGVVLYEQGNYEKALEPLWEALRLRLKLLGKDHIHLAIVWYNIGSVYLAIGDDHKTVEYYKEALRIQKLALGDEHENVGRTLRNLGSVHWERGELDLALPVFEKGLAIAIQCNGREHTIVAKTLERMGNIHLQRAHTDKFVDCMSQALRIYRRLGKSDDILMISGFHMYSLSKRHPECAAIA